MTQDNPSAFPSRVDEPMMGGGSYRNDRPGMTLRDYFAGQAVPALVAAMAADNYEMGGRIPAIVAAEDAYKLADAMLAARSTNDMEGEGR